jgi:hypothetical protein
MNTHAGRDRSILMMIAGAMVMCAMAGCSTLNSLERDPYGEALQTCRFKANGNQVGNRTPLPAANPRISSCLKRAGWNPDGTRIPASPDVPVQ